MKVLLVHNYYQSSSPSGEDMVFKNEINLLKNNGVELITYTKHNDDIQNFNILEKSNLVFENIWSKGTYNELKSLVKTEKPDICHFHNIFYLISPSAYNACVDAGVPIVQTLHNFRFFCVNGLLMRDGKTCEKCLGKLPWRGVINGCYRDSIFYSAGIALMEGVHRLLNTLSCKIDAYIVFTEFSRQKFVECGLPQKKIFLKPNFLADPPKPMYNSGGYGVFIGRLSAEKGLKILLDAVKTLNATNNTFRFKIIGAGPQEAELERAVKDENIPNFEIVGRQSFSACMDFLKESSFLLLPSICYEGFPMAIREAYACGKPVIASRLGAMAELIDDTKTGLLFEPGNSADLAVKIKWMVENRNDCIEMGKNARRVFEKKYTAEKNYKTLMEIYHAVLDK